MSENGKNVWVHMSPEDLANISYLEGEVGILSKNAGCTGKQIGVLAQMGLHHMMVDMTASRSIYDSFFPGKGYKAVAGESAIRSDGLAARMHADDSMKDSTLRWVRDLKRNCLSNGAPPISINSIVSSDIYDTMQSCFERGMVSHGVDTEQFEDRPEQLSQMYKSFMVNMMMVGTWVIAAPIALHILDCPDCQELSSEHNFLRQVQHLGRIMVDIDLMDTDQINDMLKSIRKFLAARAQHAPETK